MITLKLKRNLPVILALVTIVMFLALAMGHQPVIAYAAQAGNQYIQQAVSTTLILSNPGTVPATIY